MFGLIRISESSMWIQLIMKLESFDLWLRFIFIFNLRCYILFIIFFQNELISQLRSSANKRRFGISGGAEWSIERPLFEYVKSFSLSSQLDIYKCKTIKNFYIYQYFSLQVTRALCMNKTLKRVLLMRIPQGDLVLHFKLRFTFWR